MTIVTAGRKTQSPFFEKLQHCHVPIANGKWQRITFFYLIQGNAPVFEELQHPNKIVLSSPTDGFQIAAFDAKLSNPKCVAHTRFFAVNAPQPIKCQLSIVVWAQDLGRFPRRFRCTTAMQPRYTVMIWISVCDRHRTNVSPRMRKSIHYNVIVIKLLARGIHWKLK